MLDLGGAVAGIDAGRRVREESGQQVLHRDFDLCLLDPQNGHGSALELPYYSVAMPKNYQGTFHPDSNRKDCGLDHIHQLCAEAERPEEHFHNRGACNPLEDKK